MPEEELTPAEVTAEQLLPELSPELLPELVHSAEPVAPQDESRLRAMIEAVVYLTDQPLTVDQITAALGRDRVQVAAALAELVAEYERPEHGVSVREVAGGFSMATKPEHHDEVRQFVRNLQPTMKLSLPSLETLAVIAYKQPITAPEIMEIRGVQGAGVLKTLLDRKLIAAAGRKNVVGKPILYKTTREFLVQFGLKDMSELPSIKEFEEIRRMSVADEDPVQGNELPLHAVVPEAQGEPEIPADIPAEGTDDGA